MVGRRSTRARTCCVLPAWRDFIAKRRRSCSLAICWSSDRGGDVRPEVDGAPIVALAVELRTVEDGERIVQSLRELRSSTCASSQLVARPAARPSERILGELLERREQLAPADRGAPRLERRGSLLGRRRGWHWSSAGILSTRAQSLAIAGSTVVWIGGAACSMSPSRSTNNCSAEAEPGQPGDSVLAARSRTRGYATISWPSPSSPSRSTAGPSSSRLGQRYSRDRGRS